ncbi:hypothetical protein CNMCM5623_000582 [Aspergillus felis]|uniref:Carrier domain-containing protein n=1 Tax=Aspergillus felis TaxID=1287682 RepID=A0A8H6Q4Y9_9EURO|nr:hypothetical protein CNMCM5623_000582 [Aspergillus felis]KAF7183029.1 hypothetical protein CNMCM7691_002864 [Aspergillus felis]
MTLPILRQGPNCLATLLGVLRQIIRNPSRPFQSLSLTSEQEKVLRSLWALLFHKEPSDISATSTLFSHGGDSISAINLVSKCKAQGYVLAVSDVIAF